MKVCVSEFTYETFEEILEKNFSNEEFILINSEGEITKGEGNILRIDRTKDGSLAWSNVHICDLVVIATDHGS